MTRLVCVSRGTLSPLYAIRAFAAAVEHYSTAGSILATRVAADLPDQHDVIFGAPEEGGGILGETDAEAARVDGGPLMTTVGVARARIDAEPGVLGSFYGGSRAGEIVLLCRSNHCGGLVYRVEARSAGDSEMAHGAAAVLAWSEAAARRISAADAVINGALPA